MTCWEERMSRRAAARAQAEHDERFPAIPEPVNDLCPGCYAWRRFGWGDRRFAWFRSCDQECDHDHHGDEIWVGAAISDSLSPTPIRCEA